MTQRNNKFDTRLIVYRSRQVFLSVVVLSVTILFGVLIREGLAMNQHCIVIGGPLCLFGLAFLLYPATEEWEYKAWQNKPTMIEQHFDR